MEFRGQQLTNSRIAVNSIHAYCGYSNERSLPSIVTLEISHVSFDDHFAALQIDLCVRGWIEGVWRNRHLHHSHQFPNYVCSIKRDSTLLLKNIAYYTPSPPQKQDSPEVFASKQESVARYKYYNICPRVHRFQTKIFPP